jgi:hypothetical protein
MDYQKYGLNPEGTAQQFTRDQALQAAMETVNADLAVILEADEEDRAVLQERAEAARLRAETLRKEAKLTKGEIRSSQRNALVSKCQEIAAGHLALEVARANKAAAGESIDAEEAGQRQAEEQLAVVERLLGDYA